MARKLASRTTKAAKKSAKTVWPMTLLHKSKCIQILSEVTFLIIKFRYCEKATNIRKKICHFVLTLLFLKVLRYVIKRKCTCIFFKFCGLLTISEFYKLAFTSQICTTFLYRIMIFSYNYWGEPRENAEIYFRKDVNPLCIGSMVETHSRQSPIF